MSGQAVRTASRAGHDRPNEDLVVVAGDGVVLVDGAGLPGIAPPGAVAAYVRSLCSVLADGLSPATSLPELLATAIRAVPAPEGVMAAAALVRLGGGGVEVLVLGDCTVLVVVDDDIDVVHDPREKDVRREVLATAAKVEEQTAAFRARRNRPDGFWVVGADPAVAEHAVRRTYDLASVRELVLLSNGVIGLTPAEVVALLHDGGPEAVLDHSLPGDDATVAWRRLGAPPAVGPSLW